MAGTSDEDHQHLARVLTSRLESETIGRFSHDIEEYDGVCFSSLVSGTRDACASLFELGVLTVKTPGFYEPAMPVVKLASWIEKHEFSRKELDWLLRGMCHIWSSFLADDATYDAYPPEIEPVLFKALSDTGYIESVDEISCWFAQALPWLLESGLADLKVVRAAPADNGRRILLTMPIDVRSRYAESTNRMNKRTFSVICAHWNGSVWQDKYDIFILPNIELRLAEVKSALELLQKEAEPS